MKCVAIIVQHKLHWNHKLQIIKKSLMLHSNCSGFIYIYKLPRVWRLLQHMVHLSFSSLASSTSTPLCPWRLGLSSPPWFGYHPCAHMRSFNLWCEAVWRCLSQEPSILPLIAVLMYLMEQGLCGSCLPPSPSNSRTAGPPFSPAASSLTLTPVFGSSDR